MQHERSSRAVVFAGIAALGAWHVSRLQSPSIGVDALVLPLLYALALALLATRSRRALVVGVALWAVGVLSLVGDRWPSRSHPLAPFSTAIDRLREGGGRFATVLLPFDPASEPGVHRLLIAALALWLAVLALVWLVAHRPIPTALLAALPVAIASSEFPLPRPGLRVALLVTLVLATLSSGRRAGLAPALALGGPLVLVALVAGGLPGVAHGALVDWRAWGGSTGGSGGDVADVRYAWDQSYRGLHFTGDPTVVLKIRSPRPSYWRVTVLDAFDGLRFAERDPAAETALPGAEAHVEPPPTGVRTQLQVEVDALDEPYLIGAGVPVAYRVPVATGGGTIDANGVVRLLRPPPHGTTYDVSAVIADPTADELRHPRAGASSGTVDEVAAIPFTNGPPVPAFGVADRESAVAAVLAGRGGWQAAYAWALRRTAGATTPYDVALRLQAALEAAHPYNGSATLSPGDPDALAHWIVSGEAGYCQMFSASMTELLRLLGVPARIAEGFDTGVYDPASRRYVVDDRDAHAWVEAWLPGSGFVPFDPTPGHALPNRAALVPAVHTGTQTSSRPTTTKAASTAPVATGTDAAPRGDSSLGSESSLVWLALTAAVALALAAAAIATRRLQSGRGRAHGPRLEAAAARERLATRARRRGVELPIGVTNGELAALLESELGLSAAGWADVADRAAFAPLEQALAALPQLRGETARLAGEIAERGRVTIPA